MVGTSSVTCSDATRKCTTRPTKPTLYTKRLASDEAEGSPAKNHRQVEQQKMFKPISSKWVSLEITKDGIMNGCVEVVTRNGRPFRLIDDSGFRKIIDPVLKALNAKRAITAETVKDKVQEEANSKREEISQSLKNRKFSLKIDRASRLDRLCLASTHSMPKMENYNSSTTGHEGALR
ncbi:hypothetical protein HPB48_007152 [Haemaphysalis longicornis]|uniref:Uncharacterized protein n=1 Tax=Haemaphysalis longicornis TaxID=44386 RepID=A0A9J6GKJ8_HAELO|nr:hypothetical protein HPB48_007152 [Haemaphysalis longicornis]